MTSSTSHPNYVYVIIRLKMSKSINGITGSLFCHYGETDDAFLIGGLVEPDETFMASVIRHCRRLVDFHLKPNHRLCYGYVPIPYVPNTIHYTVHLMYGQPLLQH